MDSVLVVGIPLHLLRHQWSVNVYSAVYYPRTFSRQLRDVCRLGFMDVRHFAETDDSFSPERMTLNTYIDDIEHVRVEVGFERAVVGWRTWLLLSQAVNILREGVPPHLNAEEVANAMIKVNGVREVHDLHIWTITSGRDALSAHIIVSAGENRDRVLLDLQHTLRTQFEINHLTLQMISLVRDAHPVTAIHNRRAPMLGERNVAKCPA